VAPQLTSSFGEYRPGRFHAGLDLRTGEIGKKVYAAADGYVSRVSCSPGGYGKAIYLTLEDGNTVVYAHLDSYYDDLAQYIRRSQHAAKSYRVDLYPTSDQFPVTRGQIIARSGQTGIGAPHLHYEIRDANQQPLSPKTLGLTWPDTARPTLKKLLVAPADINATVNGDVLPVSVKVTAQGSGRYRTESLRASGAVVFGLDLIDPGLGGYKLGIHSLRLLEDETEVFRVQHDLLSYPTQRHGIVSYHPYLKNNGRYQLLWRWPGNVCPSYQHSPGDGWVSAPVEGEKKITIEATDFLGNQAVLNLTLLPEEEVLPGDLPDNNPVDLGKGSVDLSCFGNHLVVTARFSKNEPLLPTLSLGAGEPPVFKRIDARTFRATCAPRDSRPWEIQVNHPRMDAYNETITALVRGEDAYQLESEGMLLKTPKNAAYGALFARTERLPLSPEKEAKKGQPNQPHWATSPGKDKAFAYHLWPDDTPLDNPVEIVLPKPESMASSRHLGIYRWTSRSWNWQGGQAHAKGLSLSTRRFGTYAVLEDNSPPDLTITSPPQNYKSKTSRPILTATLTDKGSGIDQITVTCNGKWLLTAYDPERRRIAWERDEDLPPGPVLIEFHITDEAGNSNIRTRSITIPQ
jgi:hypothetical protein